MGAHLGLALAISVLVLAGCGSEQKAAEPSLPRASATPTAATPSTTPSGTGIPRLRVRDDGASVALTVGGTASVMLGDPVLQWGDPVVDGAAVTISEDISDAASSGRSWTVTARQPGESRVRIVGSPACRQTTPPCAAPERLWSVRFTVS